MSKPTYDRYIAIYESRQNEDMTWAAIAKKFGICDSSCKRAYDLVNDIYTLSYLRGGYTEDDMQVNFREMCELISKFADEQDVMKIVKSLILNGRIYTVDGLKSLDIDKTKVQGIGEKYIEVVRNAVNYMKHNVKYTHTIHVTISEYSYKILKEHCSKTGLTMGETIGQALADFCNV